MRRVAILLGLLLIPALGLAADDPERVVRSFYESLAAGDIEGADARWRGALPTQWSRGFTARCVRLHSIETRVIPSPDAARLPSPAERERVAPQEPGEGLITVDARVLLTSTTRAGKSVHETRRLRFELDGDEIVKATTSEEALVAKIVETPESEWRNLLVAHHDEVDATRLVATLCRRALVFINQQQGPRARRLMVLADTIAEDDGARSEVRSVESILERHEGVAGVPRAIALGEEAVALAEKAGEPDTLARALLRLGRAQSAQSRFVLEPFERVMAMSDDLVDIGVAAHVATQLASAASIDSNFCRSFEYSLLALEHSRASGDPAAMVSAEMNLSGAYAERNDGQLAVEHLRAARELALRAGLDYVTASITAKLASHLVWSGDEVAGQRMSEEAIALISPPMPHEVRSEIFVARADVAHVAGCLDDARRWLQEAIDCALLASEHRRLPLTLHKLAGLFMEDERWEDALAAAERAYIASMGSPDFSRRIQVTMAAVHRRLGMHDDAETLLRMATDEMRRNAGQAMSSDRQARATAQDIALHAGELVAMLVDRNDTREALRVAEQARADVLWQKRNGMRPDLLPLMTDAERAEYLRLERDVTELNRAKIDGAPGVDEKLLRARLALDDHIGRFYASQPASVPLDPALRPVSIDLDAALADTAIVYYVVTHHEAMVFALRRDRDGSTRVESRRLPADAVVLRELVGRFRAQVERMDLRYATAARELYDLLLAPVEELTRGRKICIVPDDVLWQLPFHVLIARDGRAVAERSTVSYAYSLALLHAAMHTPHRRTATEMLALANPEIRVATLARTRSIFRSRTLGDLPDAETEALAAARIHGRTRSRVYLGRHATEAVLKREGAGARIIHIAAHGIADESAPMFSSLVLASEGEDDGVLEAREIARMRIDADLAVLSACDTARGAASAGEGLVGLAWAFLAAGTRTTVVSQWKAESEATSKLMIAFHRNLLRGRSPAEALKEAQLVLRRDPRYASPFFWAPFVVIGAP